MLSAIYNSRIISPTLAASGQPSEAALADIQAAGYQVVINLALHDDPRYSLPDEAGTLAALGLRYVHIPVPFDAPGLGHLARFFAAMDAHAGQRLWVHCAANKRVSVFLGLYWHLRQGQPLAPAMALQRDIWEPDAVWLRFMAQALSGPPAT